MRRIAVTYLGRLMELGPTLEIGERPLHPYTQALMSADPLPLPSHLRAGHRRIVLEGEIPSPIHPPSGCRFRTRCPAAQERCAADTPAWRELRPSHWVACHFSTAEGPPTARGLRDPGPAAGLASGADAGAMLDPTTARTQAA
jgi:oligopeptide/dipeptide ABC transporter ATP-binding protein